nr:hypothetical protein [Agromyces marinus]
MTFSTSQPALSVGVTERIDSGISTAYDAVGEPSQPWPEANSSTE